MRRSLDPQDVSDQVWYYEEGRYLTFVVRAGNIPHDVAGTVQFRVPLRMLENSLARSPRAKKSVGRDPRGRKPRRVKA